MAHSRLHLYPNVSECFIFNFGRSLTIFLCSYDFYVMTTRPSLTFLQHGYIRRQMTPAIDRPSVQAWAGGLAGWWAERTGRWKGLIFMSGSYVFPCSCQEDGQNRVKRKISSWQLDGVKARSRWNVHGTIRPVEGSGLDGHPIFGKINASQITLTSFCLFLTTYLPTYVDIFYLINFDKKLTFFTTYQPTSSCQRCLWTAPNHLLQLVQIHM